MNDQLLNDIETLEGRGEPDENGLLPCPFCNGVATFVSTVSPVFKKVSKPERVSCHKCGCTTPRYETAKEAAEAWNRRVG